MGCPTVSGSSGQRLTLDPEQARLRDDFAVDNLTYAFRSGEARPDPDKGCEFGEAAASMLWT